MKIAIDGPAGSGKSTIAKSVSKKLKINYLDTGAMYRSIAYALIKMNVDPSSDLVNNYIDDINIDVRYIDNVQHMILNNTDITDFIRNNEISIGASNVSKNHKVRKKLVQLQRIIAEKSDIIMDGRDIGTFVLPDADIKFYITASSYERARRRLNEQYDSNMSIEDIEKEIIKRDKNDMERDFAPLKKADDAIVIDTTDLLAEDVINRVINIINNHE